MPIESREESIPSLHLTGRRFLAFRRFTAGRPDLVLTRRAVGERYSGINTGGRQVSAEPLGGAV